MPAPLKGALVRETARRGSNVNDVAAGILADEFGVTYTPTGRRRKVLAGSSPVLLLRVPQELKDEIHAEASRRDSNANDVILAALADGLGVPAVSNRKGRKPWPRTNGSKNGKRAKDKVRVAIIGVGNCANSLLQGVEYYKDAKPEDSVPGLMHVDLGGYHISDIEFTAAFDVVKGKVGVDLADAIWAKPNDTIKFADVPKTGDQGLARHDARRHRQVHGTGRREGARPDRRRRRDPQGDRHGRRRQLPPGRLRGGDEVVHGADPRGRRRDGELHARLHRARAVLAEALRGRRRARSSATTSSRRSARRSRTAS